MVNPLKILIVSWYMPPFNSMGGLRVGKLCKYLHGKGHEVRVLSCADLPQARTLPLEFPEDRILRTGSLDVNALPKAVQRLRRALTGVRHTEGRGGEVPPPPPTGASHAPGSTQGILRKLRRVYSEAFNFPDGQIGWLPAGIRGGKHLLSDWRPDAVVASAPPFTALMIGRILARRAGAPLIVEYRDRFLEDAYAPPSTFRKSLERRLENWWMKAASGIVTVSEPWADDYRARFGLPVCTVYNGFDPDEFPADYPRNDTDPRRLRVVYTGILYPGRRDPSPLFEAIRRLGDEGRFVEVAFYGANRALLTRMASQYGVTEHIEIHDRIPYRDSIDRQMNADVLLLLQWNDPSEAGNVPGKVFEYLAARRPVLGLGLEQGVPAQIIRERSAGIYTNDPAMIEAALRRWINEKQCAGSIALLPLTVREGFSRPEQYQVFETFLDSIVRPALSCRHGRVPGCV